MTQQKRNFVIPTTLYFFGLCLISCIVSVQLLSKGCLWWECAPNRSFDVLELELDPELFPTGVFNPMSYDSDDNPDTVVTGIQTIYWDEGNGLAIYIVDKFALNRKSKREFKRIRNSFFVNKDSEVAWPKSDNITYVSPLADEYFVGCGKLWRSDFRCGMVARYQEFVVFFNATISEKMSYQDFQNAVIFIDKQISSRLYDN